MPIRRSLSSSPILDHETKHRERPPSSYPSTQSQLMQYELEFGKPSSSHTRRLALISGQCQFRSYSPSHTTTPTSKHPSTITSLPAAYNNYASISSSTERLDPLYRVPEDGDPMEFPSIPPSQSCGRYTVNQDDIDYDRSRRITSIGSEYPLGYLSRQSLVIDEDEDEDRVLDEELARQGLYRGSYRQLVSLYTITPIFTLLVFITLAYFPNIVYPLSPNTTPGAPHPYAPYLPFPLPESLTAASFWAISHLLNYSVFLLFSTLFSPSSLTSISLTTLTQSSISIIIRQAVMPILLIPRHAVYDHPTWHDVTFRRVWWVALGWAAAEAMVGIKQGYEGISLYQTVLVSVRRVVVPHKQDDVQVRRSRSRTTSHESSRDREVPPYVNSRPGEGDGESQPLLERRPSVVSFAATRNSEQLRNDIEEEVERDIDELIYLRGREELEELYGMPFIYIPVFISCLHRLNSALFILGSTLFLTAAYMRSTLSLQPSTPQISPLPKNNTPVLVCFTITLLLQWLLALLHTPRVLPRIGVQTFVFIGVMVGLGIFFGGLSVWEGID